MPTAVDTRPPRHRPTSARPEPRPRFRDAADMWSDIATGWADALDDAFSEMADAIGRDVDRRAGTRRKRRGGCGCDNDCICEPDCPPDSCHCQCCISDADLVVHARLGEVRIVPIRLENRRRRARQITLDLGAFHTSGGKAAPVQGTIVGEQSFELEACEDRLVTLAIRPAAYDGNDDKYDERASDERGVLPDVDDCVVVYGELRVAGCDIRAIRIAVALIPRDCDAYVAECGCGCC